MKLKTKCAIHKGALECQLAAMPNSTVCWFHMNNSVLFPRDLGECVVPRIALTQFKALLLERQGNVCAICGYRFYGDVGIDVDHLWPRIAGGKNVLANLGAVHSTCNRAVKRALLLHDPEIREKLKEITKHWTREEAATMQALSDEEEAEVCGRYLDGGSPAELAEAFVVDGGTIHNILKRKGIKTRSLSEARRLFHKNNRHPNRMSEEKEKEVCGRYLDGGSLAELGRAFGVHAVTISSILKRSGVEVRSVKEAKGGLTDEQENEVCRRYLEGENTTELGKAFGVHHKTIFNILERSGVHVPSRKPTEVSPTSRRMKSAGGTWRGKTPRNSEKPLVSLKAPSAKSSRGKESRPVPARKPSAFAAPTAARGHLGAGPSCPSLFHTRKNNEKTQAHLFRLQRRRAVPNLQRCRTWGKETCAFSMRGTRCSFLGSNLQGQEATPGMGCAHLEGLAERHLLHLRIPDLPNTRRGSLHLWPWNLGGKNNIENLGLAHAKCNLLKKNQEIWNSRMLERNIKKHHENGVSKRFKLEFGTTRSVCVVRKGSDCTRPQGIAAFLRMSFTGC